MNKILTIVLLFVCCECGVVGDFSFAKSEHYLYPGFIKRRLMNKNKIFFKVRSLWFRCKAAYQVHCVKFLGFTMLPKSCIRVICVPNVYDFIVHISKCVCVDLIDRTILDNPRRPTMWANYRNILKSLNHEGFTTVLTGSGHSSKTNHLVI